MSQELIYTSAPQGLKPGSQGFCTVACTRGMSAALMQQLESLSTYRHLYPPQDARAALNPVAYSHWVLNIAGRRKHVLSRICDAGLDYSLRNNNFAHHIVLDPTELPPGGPAWLLAQKGFLREHWEGEPQLLPTGPTVPSGDCTWGICKKWEQATGDAGWAGVWVETVLDRNARPAVLIYPPGTKVLDLLEESLALLPPSVRWEVTLSTYFTKLPPGIECRWRCMVEGTPEAAAARRNMHKVFLLDLCRQLGQAVGGMYVEAARRGVFPIPSPAVAPPMELPVPYPDEAQGLELKEYALQRPVSEPVLFGEALRTPPAVGLAPPVLQPPRRSRRKPSPRWPWLLAATAVLLSFLASGMVTTLVLRNNTAKVARLADEAKREIEKAREIADQTKQAAEKAQKAAEKVREATEKAQKKAREAAAKATSAEMEAENMAGEAENAAQQAEKEVQAAEQPIQDAIVAIEAAKERNVKEDIFVPANEAVTEAKKASSDAKQAAEEARQAAEEVRATSIKDIKEAAEKASEAAAQTEQVVKEAEKAVQKTRQAAKDAEESAKVVEDIIVKAKQAVSEVAAKRLPFRQNISKMQSVIEELRLTSTKAQQAMREAEKIASEEQSQTLKVQQATSAAAEKSQAAEQKARTACTALEAAKKQAEEHANKVKQAITRVSKEVEQVKKALNPFCNLPKIVSLPPPEVKAPEASPAQTQNLNTIGTIDVSCPVWNRKDFHLELLGIKDVFGDKADCSLEKQEPEKEHDPITWNLMFAPEKGRKKEKCAQFQLDNKGVLTFLWVVDESSKKPSDESSEKPSDESSEKPSLDRIRYCVLKLSTSNSSNARSHCIQLLKPQAIESEKTRLNREKEIIALEHPPKELFLEIIKLEPEEETLSPVQYVPPSRKGKKVQIRFGETNPICYSIQVTEDGVSLIYDGLELSDHQLWKNLDVSKGKKDVSKGKKFYKLTKKSLEKHHKNIQDQLGKIPPAEESRYKSHLTEVDELIKRLDAIQNRARLRLRVLAKIGERDVILATTEPQEELPGERTPHEKQEQNQ